jgi:hypothetical protein
MDAEPKNQPLGAAIHEIMLTCDAECRQHGLMSMMTLTQLVARLAPLSPEEPATLTRQVRLWTEIGALPVIGERFVGQGKARLYPERALLISAVAIELSNWGMVVRSIAAICGGLALIWPEHGPLLEGGRDGTKQVRLMVKTHKSPLIEAWLEEAGGELGDLLMEPDAGAPRSSLLMVNLTRLWGKLR